MAFWKKSEDPWDIDPEKRRRQQEKAWKQAEERDLQGDEARQEEESFGELIGSLFRKKEQTPPQARSCPWCQKEMTLGYITAGNGVALWQDWKPTALNIPPKDSERFSIMDEEPLINRYCTAWYCRDCKKITLDVSDASAGPNYVWENGKVKLPEQQGDSGAVWGAQPNGKAYEDYKNQMERWTEEKDT